MGRLPEDLDEEMLSDEGEETVVWPPRGPADVMDVLLASLPEEIDVSVTIDQADDSAWPCTAELELPDGRRFALFCAEMPIRGDA
jgi:hypothetical protein